MRGSWVVAAVWRRHISHGGKARGSASLTRERECGESGIYAFYAAASESGFTSGFVTRFFSTVAMTGTETPTVSVS